jgi:hypothetical protein
MDIGMVPRRPSLGDVGAECDARDQDAAPKRARPRAPRSRSGRPHSLEQDPESAQRQSSENTQAIDRHCQNRDVGSIGGVVWNTDTRSKPVDAVVA